MLKPKTQNDIVRQKLEKEEYLSGRDYRDVLKFAGYETLHERSLEEIAQCFANILKSRPGIKELLWKAGQPVEVVYRVR